ncbi:dihydrolipoamide acetyltransferase family protein [Aneurinibacillus aneurinilyticus]|uniref:dihydrolipoamide acetyltransferase family protein n=1 Tax=Aneurinibacillus aneurinilyticus TaxID=1391 RepID=UPI003524AA3F
MATKVVMPKLGATMEQGTIVNWFVKVGDRVEYGEPLFEVLTDKVNIEVEAEMDGILLKTCFEADEVVQVHDVIAYIGEEGEVIEDAEGGMLQQASALSKSGAQETAEKFVSEKQPETEPQTKIRRTPAARKLAKENSLSLETVQGTGPKGRIQKADIEEHLRYSLQKTKATPLAQKIAHSNHLDLSQIQGSGINGKIVWDDVLKYANVEKDVSVHAVNKTAFTGMRKVIADRMVQSAYTAPHVTLTSEIDMTNCVNMRKELLPIIEKQNGYRLSFNEIIVKAVAHTLQNHPAINVSLQDDEIIHYSTVNIGFAVAIPNGLVVPVVKNANQKGLAAITEECKTLGSLAREGRLLPDHMKDGTFTISNLGMYAVDAFTPIINQPEAAILGVGRIQEKPMAVNGEIKLRSMMALSLSFDHRIVDGAPAAEFLTDVKDALENPYKLIV